MCLLLSTLHRWAKQCRSSSCSSHRAQCNRQKSLSQSHRSMQFNCWCCGLCFCWCWSRGCGWSRWEEWCQFRDCRLDNAACSVPSNSTADAAICVSNSATPICVAHAVKENFLDQEEEGDVFYATFDSNQQWHRRKESDDVDMQIYACAMPSDNRMRPTSRSLMRMLKVCLLSLLSISTNNQWMRKRINSFSLSI